jgi:hypothetical protein
MRAARYLVTAVLTALVLAWDAPAAEASTTISPGHVVEITGSVGPLPSLPAPADGRIAGFGFFARVTGDECAAPVGDPGAQFSAPAGDIVCAFSVDLSFVNPDFEIDTYNTPPRFSAKVLVGTTPFGIPASDFTGTGQLHLRPHDTQPARNYTLSPR